MKELNTLTELYDYINTLNISKEDKDLIINTIKTEREINIRLANNDESLRKEIERLKRDNQMCRLTIDKMVKVPYTYGIKLSTDEEANNDNNR